MTAGIVSLCGAWGGQLAGPTGFNKKGMFENTEIRNAVVKPFLVKMGCDPLGQKPLPDPVKDPKLKLEMVNHAGWLRDRVLSIIRNQGYPNGQPWFYKGAKICLVWQMWHLAFPKARWIIVRRHDRDIIRSCVKTTFMRKCRNEQEWQEWIDIHKARFDEIKTMWLDVGEVYPQDIINGDFSVIKNIIKRFGLVWRKEKVVEFVTPSLWTARTFESVIEKELSDVNLSSD
jgi:hypothetical protein